MPVSKTVVEGSNPSTRAKKRKLKKVKTGLAFEDMDVIFMS